jgi:hypothetical protein
VWWAYVLIVLAGGFIPVLGKWDTHINLTDRHEKIAGAVGAIAFLAILWRAGFGAAAWGKLSAKSGGAESTWWIRLRRRLSAKPGGAESTQWIRNRMAKWMRAAMLVVAGLVVFAIVDAWGQSIYAVTSYANNWHDASAAITGVLGLTALAPVVRSLVLKAGGKAGKLKIPFQLIALAFGIVVVFVLLTGLAFTSHALAWGGNVPLYTKGDPTVSDPTVSNPGQQIYRAYSETNSLKLTAERLIQVVSVAEPPPPKSSRHTMVLLWTAFGLNAALSLLFARTLGFLNLSSYHALYSARIVRAYQGASNRKRWADDADVTLTEPDDDIAWNAYKPYENGGPLHLVNCTVNCTKSIETAMESTTARGLNLCIGPAGVSYGQHHAIFPDRSSSERKISENPTSENQPPVGTPVKVEPLEVKPLEMEPLTLGEWIGISGAAFTTGLGNVGGGAGTKPGTSLLCGLFNVRLGYWWRNQFSPSGKWSVKKLFPVQACLADEFTGSFHIINRDRWYLSDGGHFENTAAYELIRRRVPFIILADCGADPDGEFADLGNLVRRVRIDFGAEMTFPVRADVEKVVGQDPNIGTLTDLYPELQFIGRTPGDHVAAAIKSIQTDEADPLQARRVQKYAAIAEVEYPEGGHSIILIIKPGMTGDESEDLLNYQCSNGTFPQQTTAEQFYDEAQWEAYRKLGQHAMDLVVKSGWVSRQLTKEV